LTDPDITLADLVGDVGVFAQHHWGRRALERSSGVDFAPLLDIAAVERLLLASARRPTFRLVTGGERLPPERSTSPVRMGGETLVDVADVAKIAGALDGGATLVLQALQRTWPPLMELCQQLEAEIGHPVQANAYLTPAHARGLARHADEHDVLVLQSIGHKAWDVEGLGPVRLTPGDVLYLPAHTPHAAEAQDATSLHLTIGILRVTYGQVVHRLLHRLEDVGLDAPLPLGFTAPDGAAQLRDELARRLHDLADAVAAADPGEVGEHERRRARRRRRPGPGRLESILAIDAIDASTVVVAPPASSAELRQPDPDGPLELRLVDRVLEVPSPARPALEVLLEGGEVKVGELPALSDTSAVVLVRRLVREGWLQVVHP
jgi:cupin superfamily protein